MHLQIISTAVWCRAVRSVNGVVRAQYSTTGTILDAAWGRFAGSRRAVLCLLQTRVLTVVSTSGDVQDVPLPAVFQRIHPLPAAVLLSVRGLPTVHAWLHRAQSLHSASSVHCAQPWSAKCYSASPEPHLQGWDDYYRIENPAKFATVREHLRWRPLCEYGHTHRRSQVEAEAAALHLQGAGVKPHMLQHPLEELRLVATAPQPGSGWGAPPEDWAAESVVWTSLDAPLAVTANQVLSVLPSLTEVGHICWNQDRQPAFFASPCRGPAVL